MNFYDVNQGYPPSPQMMNNQMPLNIPPQDINYKINDLENRLKKLELRIQKLESSLSDNINNYEPDTGLYMI